MESVKPLSEVIPPPAPASAPQVMNPWALVSRTEEPEQLRRLSILIPVPVCIPPANVLVAVVEVAKRWERVGVEVETTFPFESVESNMFAPVLFRSRMEPAEKARVVAESKVKVPEVKLSEVSERRN